MISFKNDYSEGAHPRILEALGRINFEQTDGYGEDGHCAAARRRIQELTGLPDCEVRFLAGGTQTNLTLISHALRPYEAVISADSGHICVHEAGSIEATGHKAIALPSPDGKLTPEAIEETVLEHQDPQMVQPKLCYLSFTTEVGTLYTRKELEAIREVCDRYGLLLYLDGARLASGLTAPGSDLTLPDLGRLCDAFYIGGTKNGALFGEALVLPNPSLSEGFGYSMRQRGGLLAKGWLIGVQFEELLRDDLYFSLARHANEMAALLAEGIKSCGISFQYPPQSNQLFPILSAAQCEALSRSYSFASWTRMRDGYGTIRLVTSWATLRENVEKLIADLRALS